MKQYTIGQTRINAGRNTFQAITAGMAWKGCRVSLDAKTLTFPAMIYLEVSDDGQTWKVIMSSRDTSLGVDKQGNPRTTLDFSVAYPNSLLSSTAQLRVRVEASSPFDSDGGTITVF